MTLNPKLSWQVPLAGSAFTLINCVGWSIANFDIRPEVQWIGLDALMACALVGGCLTALAFRSLRVSTAKKAVHHAVAGLAFNLTLASVTAVGVGTAYVHNRPATHPETRTADDFEIPVAFGSRLPIWIDTDPACDQGPTHDPDDCWALLTALRSPEVAVQGISTVFGNLDGNDTYRIAGEVIKRFSSEAHSAEGLPPVFAGAFAPGASTGEPSRASEELAARLRRQKLTIMALGPLTNIASVIAHHPDVVGNIERIIMVGGKPPGRLLHPGKQWWFHFRDFNVSKDTRSAEFVLQSGVPLVLIPFDVAEKVLITQADLNRLAAGDQATRWLSAASVPWASFWKNTLHREGFYPFDSLAAMYVTAPEGFRCKVRKARMGFSVFLEPLGMGRDLEVADDSTGTQIYYCFDLERQVKDQLVDHLMGRNQGQTTSFMQMNRRSSRLISVPPNKAL